MLNGMPNQMLAMVTESSDSEGSASQCTGVPITKLITPYWVANSHFQSAPTTSAGSIQAASSRPRRKCTPGKRCEKNSATMRPIPSCATTLAATNSSELSRTLWKSGSIRTSR